MNTGKLKLWWVPVASTRDVRKWRRNMLAIDGVLRSLAYMFGYWGIITE